MTTRTSTLAASALLLVLGCSAPSSPTDIEAHRPGPSAAPAIAAAGPRVLSNQVVFAPAIPAALRAPAPAARRRGQVFSVGSGDPAAVADGDELPPVPVPEGWVPAEEPTSREILGLDDAAFEEAGNPGDAMGGPVFAEDQEFEDADFNDTGFADAGFNDAGFEEAGFEEAGFQDARAVIEDPGLDESTWDEDSEEIVIEEVRYIETVEVETRTIEIGTPVLVVEGYSSWGYGTYPVVRSSRRFDPCFVPPRGACWYPVAFDPCWNACTDPEWGTWNMVCDERNRRGHGAHVGLEVTGDRSGPAPPKAPGPRRDPVVRQDPPAAPPPPAVRPPATPVARTTGFVRPAPAVVEIPSSPAPRSEPVARASRVVLLARARSHEGDAVPAPRTIAPSRRIPPRAAPVVEVPAGEPADPVASTRPPRPAAEPRAERSLMRRAGRDEGIQSPAEPASAPAPRTERPRGRDRAEPRDEPRAEPQAAPVREPRRVEAPRPEPAREPAHGRNGGGRDRTPEVQAPPPPPPPPPPAPAHRSGGKHGR